VKRNRYKVKLSQFFMIFILSTEVGMKGLLILLMLPILLLVSCSKDDNPSGPTEPQGILYEVDGIKIPVVSGTPYQMGTQLGDLMGIDIQDLYESMIEPQFSAGYYNYDVVLAQANEFWDTVIPPWMKAICDGMSINSGLTLEELKILQVWATVVLMNEACSGVIAWEAFTEDGGVLLGHNHDSPSNEIFSQLACVTVYKLSGAPHEFAAIGFPGMLPVITGINDAGLVVASNAAPMSNAYGGYDLSQPWHQIRSFEWLLNLGSLDELRSVYLETPVAIGCNYLIADQYGGTCIETAMDVMYERESNAAGLIAETNHYIHPLLQGHNTIYYEGHPDNSSNIRYINMLNIINGMNAVLTMEYIMDSILRLPENQGGVLNNTVTSVVYDPSDKLLLMYSEDLAKTTLINLSNYFN
jgi:hypothetical protein